MNENIIIITKVLRDTGLDRIKKISFDVAQQYLQDIRNLGYSHKHLSNIKSSLQRVIDKYSQGKRLTIPKIYPEFISSVRAKQQGNLANKNRAYLDSDLNKIIQNMSPHMRFPLFLHTPLVYVQKNFLPSDAMMKVVLQSIEHGEQTDFITEEKEFAT
ncbi:hypothetical protein AB4251_18175 [Vibrio lentus]|uniref:Integrase n=1 Tax=Vibrio lentus TaxID=136468 RepID=A0AB36XIW2_9VIBR|nr:hypothetical protein [Vibrio lentus]MCC4838248.1 hypothetical protein [Vibrio lentus]PMI12060.1 hypothetical protein BCU51_25670 [Vibrio lentus]PMK36350.1 hypothetical protein BCU02_12120 [Vibrio lentus]PMK44353.1 hypothetical protein BCT99_24755 [Vibrio lentus]PML32978.1 hypothetical protein BCT79_14940 [Vibrio lentus]